LKGIDMTVTAFALVCFFGFLLPVPVLVWLDKPRTAQASATQIQSQR